MCWLNEANTIYTVTHKEELWWWLKSYSDTIVCSQTLEYHLTVCVTIAGNSTSVCTDTGAM